MDCLLNGFLLPFNPLECIVPLRHQEYRIVTEDRAENRVIPRDQLLKSIRAAHKAGKAHFACTMWEVHNTLDVRQWEEEILYYRTKSRPRGTGGLHWIEYHIGIDRMEQDYIDTLATVEKSPTLVRAAPLANPFNATTPRNNRRRRAAPTPSPLFNRAVGPKTSFRSSGIAVDRLLSPPIIPGLDLLAEAAERRPTYALPPPVHFPTPHRAVRFGGRRSNVEQTPCP